MAAQNSPFVEASYGWPYGSNGWNGEMDTNLVKFSYLHDRNIDAIVSSLPAIVNGKAYFNTSDNRLYFDANGQRYSSVTPKWFEVTLRTTGEVYQFDGSTLSIGSTRDMSLRDELSNRTDPAKGVGVTGFLQHGAGSEGRSGGDKLREVISLADYGNVVGGVVDAGPAFIKALAYIATKSRLDPFGLVSNRLNGFKLEIPPGDYLITTPSALSLAFSARALGLVIEAQGFARIHYAPTSPAPLIVNNDKVLFLRIKGIVFTGASADSDLISSISTGGAQDYTFDDCMFHGVWRYGMNRTGTNNNSEIRYHDCSFSGSWRAWDYVGPTGTSDQFVNQWYTECKYWSSSVWLDYHMGGHTRLVSCDISGYSPAQLPEGEGPGGNRTQYLFNLRGNAHGHGVCSLSVFGGRIEQKTQWAGLLYCEWGQGDITFDAFDAGSQTFTAFGASIMSAYFLPGNTIGPTVKWTQSQVMGFHTYTALQGGVGSKRVTYDSCTFSTVDYPDEAIVTTDLGSQPGRRPVIRMKNCRGRTLSTGTFADADINWQKSSVGHTSRKIVSLKSANGVLPAFIDGVVTVTLPIGAVITNVIIHVPPGSTGSSATANYTVTSGVTAPVTIATLAMDPISAGGTINDDSLIVCDTRDKTIIKLVPSSGMNTAIGGNSFCTIEYIG